jgi:hypothetical protein
MRAVVVVVMLASVAAADPIDDAISKKDATTLGWLAMNGEGRERERALAALVALKRLDAKSRALLPSQQVVSRELAKLGAAKTRTRAALTAESCALVTGLGGDLVVLCSERSCGGACQVLRNEATIRVRNSRWTVAATNVKRLGDTGECGCCL